jgi:uncharacterized CHY-type Zn-finger protein
MARRDKDFLCPDCFCQVMQLPQDDFPEGMFVCRRCGLGPLVICPVCMGLITIEDYIENCCPYCEEMLMFAEEENSYSGEAYFD